MGNDLIKDSRDNNEFERYKELRLLGVGIFGKTYLVQRLCDCKMSSMKVLDLKGHMDEDQRYACYKEARTTKEQKFFEVQGVLDTKDAFETEQGKLCVVQNFCPNGDLASEIKRQQKMGKYRLGEYYNEEQILMNLRDICNGLMFLHEQNIIHRNVKPSNIFLENYEGKNMYCIGDMGLSMVVSRQNVNPRNGTLDYMSPELLFPKPDSTCSFSTDIWSLGCIAYELCALRKPFSADNQSLEEISENIRDGNYNERPLQGYSRRLQYIISKMLRVDPKQRPVAEKAYDYITELQWQFASRKRNPNSDCNSCPSVSVTPSKSKESSSTPGRFTESDGTPGQPKESSVTPGRSREQDVEKFKLALANKIKGSKSAKKPTESNSTPSKTNEKDMNMLFKLSLAKKIKDNKPKKKWNVKCK